MVTGSSVSLWHKMSQWEPEKRLSPFCWADERRWCKPEIGQHPGPEGTACLRKEPAPGKARPERGGDGFLLGPAKPEGDPTGRMLASTFSLLLKQLSCGFYHLHRLSSSQWENSVRLGESLKKLGQEGFTVAPQPWAEWVTVAKLPSKESGQGNRRISAR